MVIPVIPGHEEAKGEVINIFSQGPEGRFITFPLASAFGLHVQDNTGFNIYEDIFIRDATNITVIKIWKLRIPIINMEVSSRFNDISFILASIFLITVIWDLYLPVNGYIFY